MRSRPISVSIHWTLLLLGHLLRPEAVKDVADSEPQGQAQWRDKAGGEPEQ